jgi:CBS domain-containing protein
LEFVPFNDLKRALSKREAGHSRRAIAESSMDTIHANQTLDLALVKMGQRGVSQLRVVDRDDPIKLFGILTMEDIARKLAREAEISDLRRPTSDL